MVTLSEQEQEILNRVEKQTWFKSYERNHPKSKTTKLLSKVKKGIKAGKYRKFEEYPTSRTDTDNRGHTEPKPKKEKVTKAELRKAKEQTALLYQRAPSGRKYTYTEVHEGKGSKRAYAEREKLGFDKNDFYDRKGNTTYEVNK